MVFVILIQEGITYSRLQKPLFVDIAAQGLISNHFHTSTKNVIRKYLSFALQLTEMKLATSEFESTVTPLTLNISLELENDQLVTGSIEYPNMTESHNGGAILERAFD